MKTFDLFLSKYPPDRDLRKPTSEMLERFQGKVPAELSGFLAGIWFRKLRRRLTENHRSYGLWRIRLHFGWANRTIVFPS